MTDCSRVIVELPAMMLPGFKAKQKVNHQVPMLYYLPLVEMPPNCPPSSLAERISQRALVVCPGLTRDIFNSFKNVVPSAQI